MAITGAQAQAVVDLHHAAVGAFPAHISDDAGRGGPHPRAPDARQIAYERRPNPTANDRWKSDIWVADVESGEGRVLYENGGSDVSPRWSPNGRTIGFGANEVEASSTMFRKLYLISPEGGEPRTLLEQFDNQFTTPIWSPARSWRRGSRAWTICGRPSARASCSPTAPCYLRAA